MIRPSVPRRSLRRPVSMVVQCRTNSGLRDTGELSDISSEGCCLRVPGLYFRVGTRLLLRPDGIEALSGVVRWIKDDIAGIEFDRPIYGPVLDHLVARHGCEGLRQAG